MKKESAEPKEPTNQAPTPDKAAPKSVETWDKLISEKDPVYDALVRQKRRKNADGWT